MAGPDAAELLLKSIYDETVNLLNTIKQTTEVTAKEAAEEFKKQFDNLVDEARKKIEENKKNDEKEMKKQAKEILKDHSRMIADAQKQATEATNSIWTQTKPQLENAIKMAKSTAGKNVGEFDKLLKEIVKAIEKIVADINKLINGYAKEAQTKLGELGKSV